MEIPSSLSGRFDVLLKQAANITREQLTSLDDANLIPGRNYPAKVLTRLEVKTAVIDSKQISEQTTQWLILVSGKNVLIETNATLKSGQVLNIQITAPNKDLAEQTLIIKTNTENTLRSQPASTTTNTNKQTENIEILLKAMGQTLPRQVSLAAGLNELLNRAAQTGPSNSNSAQASQELDNAKLSAAALSKLIPGKQEFTADAALTATGAATSSTKSTIQNTLSPLIRTHQNSPQTLSQTENSSPPEKLNTNNLDNLADKLASQPKASAEQLRQQTISSILNQISTQAHGTNKIAVGSEKNTEQAPHLAVVKLLQLSGALLESKLLLPDRTNIEQLFKELNAAKTSSDTSIKTHIKATAEGQKESTVRPTSTSLFHSALSATAFRNSESYQNNAAYQNNLPLQTKSSSVTAQTTSTDKTTTGLPDLKSTLMSLVVALSSNEESHGKVPRSYLDGLTQADLLKSPFGFPHLADSAIMKANALLADQELSTGQLLKLVAGMLNRIQFNQLNSLYQSQNNSNETTTAQSWFFELPILAEQNQANVFNLRIDKEGAAEKEKQRDNSNKALEWRLALSFDLKELGPVYIQVTLRPPTATSTIWAVKEDTLQLIQNERDRFHHRLEALGLELKEIQCHQGQPKQNKAKLDRGFVDTKA